MLKILGGLAFKPGQNEPLSPNPACSKSCSTGKMFVVHNHSTDPPFNKPESLKYLVISISNSKQLHNALYHQLSTHAVNSC